MDPFLYVGSSVATVDGILILKKKLPKMLPGEHQNMSVTYEAC